MSEIIKLYENAEVEKSKCWDDCTTCTRTSCDKTISYIKAEYPPFTTEKQLAIFKMFCRRYLEVSQHVKENGDLCFGIEATVGDFAAAFDKDFAECLASFVNQLWQSLTEEERNQIRSILNG